VPRRKPPFTQMLSSSERAEYENLLTDAGYDEYGKKRPSGEIAERIHRALKDAEQAGRQWATWALNDDARTGHLKRFTAWESIKRIVHTRDGERIVTRRAIMALRQRDPETGEWFWRGEDLAEMIRGELEEVMLYARRRRHSDAVLMATVRRLLDLLEETASDDTTKVSAALKKVGKTIDEVLTVDLAA
jgi:hypothetical protein